MLERFRSQSLPSSSQESISTREKCLIAFLSISLLIPLWFLGGYRFPHKLLTFGSSLITFTLLFFPFKPRHDEPDPNKDIKKNTIRLLKFPGFWIGILLMSYMLIQTLNPIWTLENIDGVEQFVYQDPIKWLPSGIVAHISYSSPTQHMIFLASPWLLSCAFWIGLHHRKSVYYLFNILIANMVIWLFFAFLQNALGSKEVLWIYRPQQWHRSIPFIGTFINPNHAAAYLNLIWILMGSYFWIYIREQKAQIQRGGMHLLIISIMLLTSGCIFITLSRFGMILHITLILLYAFFSLLIILKKRIPISSLLIIPISLLFLGIAIPKAIDWKGMEKEWKSLIGIIDGEKNDIRLVLHKGNMKMLQDRWLFGWGAGSYKIYFPTYQKKIPEIANKYTYIKKWNQEKHKWVNKKVPVFWEHAHFDAMQIAIEYGLVGGLIFLCIPLWIIIRLIRMRKALNMPLLILFFLSGVWLSESLITFVFYCPAIQILFTILILAGLKILERRHVKTLGRPKVLIRNS